MQPRGAVPQALIYGLGAAVGIGWLASTIADIAMASYATPMAVHGLMGTIVGSIFADANLRKSRRRREDEARATSSPDR